MSLRLRVFVLLALALAACGRFGASTGETDVPKPSPRGGSTPSEGSPDAPEGIPDVVWAAILADLEHQTGGSSEPDVVSAMAVTWNDGSLGCPEPGQSYTQALVDGYQVVVEVDGERYDYRVGSGRSVKLCDGGPLEGGG
jgi:hypothetical protein